MEYFKQIPAHAEIPNSYGLVDEELRIFCYNTHKKMHWTTEIVSICSIYNKNHIPRHPELDLVPT